MSSHTFADTVQSLFASFPLKLVATAIAFAVLSGVGELLRRAGPWLKDRVDDALVESLQAALMAVLTAGVGFFLIAVWEAGPQVDVIVTALDLQQDDIINVVFTAGILAAAYSLTRVSKNAIRRLSRERGAITNHQQEVLHHVAQIAIFVVAGFVVLALWNVKPESLLVGASVATVMVGLAARQTLGAVLAGFVVLFSRPFELGDWVQIGDEEGVVTDITIFNTQLRTFDEEFVMIPNDLVTDTEIVNRSRKGRLRLEVDVGVDYETHVEEAMRVATEAMQEVDLLMDKPDPHVVLSEFGGSSVVLRLRFYINNPSARKMWKARTQVIARVKDAFAQEGIKIPFPQRELSGRGEGFVVAQDRPVETASTSADGDAAGKNGEGER